jgi:glycosyltransferase involved in cell wall biosynthesis
MNINLTIVIPAKNEELNIRNCLNSLKNWVKYVIVVDSQSDDRTIEIVEEYGFEVVQFYYKGGLPKKRQWLLDNYSFKTDWILFLDTDEILNSTNKEEISNAIKNENFNGYYLNYSVEFLGRQLIYAHPGIAKLSLFRLGFGSFEKRLELQNSEMADMEIHEHFLVNGNVGSLREPVRHCNFNNLFRYISKHNEYSEWEAAVYLQGDSTSVKPSFFGSKTQRRRWLKKHFLTNRWAPLLYFMYMYIFRFGFRDGRAGFFYILYYCVYLIFISSKIYESKLVMELNRETR